MNYLAIRAENLSKQYQTGVSNPHDTLRDQLLRGHLKKLVHSISGITKETKADD